MKGSAQPARIRGHQFVGVLPELLRHPAEFLRRTMVENDHPVLELNVGLGTIYFVSQPEHIEHVLCRNVHGYWKGRVFNRIGPILGYEGLLLSEGERWLDARRLLQPAFSPRRLRRLIAMLDGIVAESVARWPRRVHLFDALRHITMRTSVAALFDRDVGDAESGSIAGAFDRALRFAPLRFFTFALPNWLPLPDARDARALHALVLKVTSRMVAEKARGGTHGDDYLSLLLARLRSDAALRSDAVKGRCYMRDHMSTALFGGYESTATSLTWALLLLARHDNVCARAAEEITSVLGDGAVADHETLARLTYTQQVIDEALRLYPPFWCSFRSALSADAIGGVTIPAGASILISPYATHRHPALWPEPERFDPARFDASRQPPRKFSYIPFLDGPRACIGKLLAQAVMKLVVVRVLQRYRLELPAGFSFESTAKATVRPKQAPWLMLVPR